MCAGPAISLHDSLWRVRRPGGQSWTRLSVSGSIQLRVPLVAVLGRALRACVDCRCVRIIGA